MNTSRRASGKSNGKSNASSPSSQRRRNGVRSIPLERVNAIEAIDRRQRDLIRMLSQVIRRNRHNDATIQEIKKQYRALNTQKMKLLRM